MAAEDWLPDDLDIDYYEPDEPTTGSGSKSQYPTCSKCGQKNLRWVKDTRSEKWLLHEITDRTNVHPSISATTIPHKCKTKWWPVRSSKQHVKQKVYQITCTYGDACGNESHYHYGYYYAESQEEIEKMFNAEPGFSSWHVEELSINDLPSIRQKMPRERDMQR